MAFHRVEGSHANASAESVTLDVMGTPDRWQESYARLRSAESERALAAGDLVRLAEAAYMLGRDDEYLHALERAYQAHLDLGAGRPAARCAFWSGLTLLLRGEAARANGWFGRAERLLERERDDCVERGYLLIAGAARARRPRRRGGARDGGRRPPRSASASATATWSRSSCRSRATRWSGWDASSRACG